MNLIDSCHASRFQPSPNHGERLGAIDCLILHYTGMADDASALAWLCNPQSQVSCHYFIREDGDILQLVPESRRAWHAGHSFWAGVTDLNSHSVGVEMVNGGHAFGSPLFPPAQIAAVVRLCADVAGRHAISPQRILAHSDIAPGRKQDPGELFPWPGLHSHGIGHWVAPHPVADGRFFSLGDQCATVDSLQERLARYGYGVERTGLYDGATQAAVAAFQRHFRPARIDGIADVSTMATLRDLLAHLPNALPVP